MEEELLEAKSIYESNLTAIEEALATDPDDTELRQVQEELRTALEATNAALHDITATAIATDIDTNTAVSHPQPQAQPTHLPRLHTNSTTPSSNIPNTKINNNARIHPRNIYSTSEPDFAALARLYPSLQPYLLPLKKQQEKQEVPPSSSIINTATTPVENSRGRRTIDFKNPAACRELTKILLKSDFGVNWDLPEGHLVPPVTNRLNYILWIEDLLNLSRPLDSKNNKNINKNEDSVFIRGLDIGCGASCIYPLLGASSLNWRFVGVDVTSEAITWAQKNVDMNEELKGLIELRKVEMQPEQKTFFDKKDITTKKVKSKEEKESYPGILASAFVDTQESFAFSMCNPPFFEKMDQAGLNPSTAFGGTAAESVYPGGEEAFVRNMYEDSLLLKTRVHWFTTMVGKKVTFKALRKWLHAEPSVHVVRTTEFFQGQTSRWGVAWSFVADPSVALKPIERGVGKEGEGISRKRVAAGADDKDEKLQLQPSLQQQQQQQEGIVVKKRKITGRSVNIHITLKDAHAALQLLNHIKTSLEMDSAGKNNIALRCSLDSSQYQLTVEPCDSDNVVYASGFTVQLLAQQAKRYVLTVALKKIKARSSDGADGAKMSANDNTNTMVWFSGMVAEIERLVLDFGAQLIS